MFPYRRGPPRRSPYPYDIKLANVGLLLGEREKGAGKVLPSEKPPDLLGVTPQEYAYSGLNPIFGSVQTWSDFSGGMGLRVQEKPDDTRYYFATNADLSVKRLWLKGPNITTLTPSTVDTTNGITHFFEVANTLFALNGRYVQRRTSDSDWDTGRIDWGAGIAAVDVNVFYTNVAAGARYAYIAMGESDRIRRFDGTNAPETHSTLSAIAVTSVGKEFWRAVSTNQLAKVNTDSDPWLAANWTANNAFYVGDKSSAVTRLAVTGLGAMLILKTDGIYTLDASGNDKKLFAHLQFAPSASNGKGYGAWLNALWVPYGNGLYQIEEELNFNLREKITQVGPELLTGNDSVVRGRITAFAGHDSLHGYAAVYNGTDSYLLKLVRDEQGNYIWHGAISAAFAGKQVTALFKSSIGAVANHTRLYLGFSDGSVGWFTLPLTNNPISDTSYAFSTAAGLVAPPTWGIGLFSSDQKGLQALSVQGLNLSTTNYVTVDYRSAPLGPFQAFGTNFQDVPWSKKQFVGSVSAVVADFHINLLSTATTSCPQVTGVSLIWRLATELRQVFDLYILAADGMVSRAGTPMHFGASRVQELVKQAAGSSGAVALTLPDESATTVAVANFGATKAWDERTRQWYGAFHIAAAELAASTTYGLVSRLNAWTVGGLSPYTVSQLNSI